MSIIMFLCHKHSNKHCLFLNFDLSFSPFPTYLTFSAPPPLRPWARWRSSTQTLRASTLHPCVATSTSSVTRSLWTARYPGHTNSLTVQCGRGHFTCTETQIGPSLFCSWLSSTAITPATWQTSSSSLRLLWALQTAKAAHRWERRYLEKKDAWINQWMSG